MCISTCRNCASPFLTLVCVRVYVSVFLESYVKTLFILFFTHSRALFNSFSCSCYASKTTIQAAKQEDEGFSFLFQRISQIRKSGVYCCIKTKEVR